MFAKMDKNHIEFVRKVSKLGTKYVINIPKDLLGFVEHRGLYKVTLEYLEEAETKAKK